MHYNKNENNSNLGKALSIASSRLSEKDTLSCAVGAASSITYKIDVDNYIIKHYGLTPHDLEIVTKKLKSQSDFLKFNFLYDRINKNNIPLSNIVISANHSPNRYYGEVQNRVNTLIQVALDKSLKPIFMTITLPSKFHKMKTGKDGHLIPNPQYDGMTAKNSVKELTKMYTRLRHDRALKELTKEQRIYFRINEPHKDGTPHTHILLFVPADKIERIEKAFKRLYFNKSNKFDVINDGVKDSANYVMKYINKTLPCSKVNNLSELDKYLSAWYSKHRIIRFNSSRTLAPLSLYRKLYNKYSLFALTKLLKEKHFTFYLTIDTDKLVKIDDEWGETVYSRNDNFDMKRQGDNFLNYSQTNDSAIGIPK